MGKKNRRRVSMLLTPQTIWNLGKLAQIAGVKDTGRVVDKLVREKMLSLHRKGGEENERR